MTAGFHALGFSDLGLPVLLQVSTNVSVKNGASSYTNYTVTQFRQPQTKNKLAKSTINIHSHTATLSKSPA
jgi:hypothetical protein